MTEITTPTIGGNIKDLRVKAKLTQIELANKMECSRDTIASIESNRLSFSTDMLLNLCNALKCSPNMIFKGLY